MIFYNPILGNSILGDGNKLSLGACQLYYGDLNPTQLTGTVNVDTNDLAHITGTGTAFTSELKEGDVISFSNSTGATLYRVVLIVDNTNLFLDKNAPISLTGSNYYKVNAIDLGLTNDVSVKLKFGKTDLKSIQTGDNPADRVVTSYECTIETEILQPSIERLKEVLSGFEGQWDSTNKDYKNMYVYLPLGARDSDIARPLHLFAIKDGEVKYDDLYHWVFPKACAEVDAEVKFNATDQRAFKVMFYCYPVEKVVGGKTLKVLNYVGSEPV
jgi:hypothetical protein